jgi:hypothetical protein
VLGLGGRVPLGLGYEASVLALGLVYFFALSSMAFSLFIKSPCVAAARHNYGVTNDAFIKARV